MSYLLVLTALLVAIVARYIWRSVSKSHWTLKASCRSFTVLLWGAVGILSLFFLFAGATGCMYSLPGVVSPDGDTVARAWSNDCGGATESAFSGVFLRSTHFTVSWSWLRSRFRPTTVFSAGEDAENIQLLWNSSNELTVRYTTDAGSPTCDATWGHVKIACQTYVPDPNKPFVRFKRSFLSVERWFW
jgi:hypothetical protein